ncbi:MAG: o-succinylbenzoate synthase [Gemmatimonadetes bacterium]|nr:o-succinylbenzoate synthase [Gemmatimonadota bacterium]
MLSLKRITLRELRLPLKEPFQISSGTQTERRIFLVLLEDGDGNHVWSECVAPEFPNYTAETIQTAWIAIRDWVAPRVLGVSFPAPDAVHMVLDKNFRGHNMAKAAVEMGLWGLAAVIRERPLANLLGGTRPTIATGISIGIQSSPAALVERARVAAAAGYRKIKLKIKPGSDLQFVGAVREALPDAPLMADANNAYTLADADTLAKLDPFGLVMLEQPLAWDDLVRHATLQKRMTTPICLDESITGVERAQDMVTLGSGRIINIKPGRVGGFTSSLEIHDFCSKRDVPVWCGGMLESGVGRAYNVALASLPGFLFPGDLSPSARYWEKDIVAPEWTMDHNGMVTVPTGPGIGVTVDVNRVDNLTVKKEVVGAK